MISYTVRVVYNGVRNWLIYTLRFWSKGYLEAIAALITLLVSDSILAFVRSPYYLPVTYDVGAVVILLMVYSRRAKWGPSFRKIVAHMSSWIVGVMAVVLLGIPEKLVSIFEGFELSSYNLMVALGIFGLLLLTLPFFLLSDLFRDRDVVRKARRRKRIPTIFNPQFVDKDQRLRYRIRAVLKENL